MSFHYLNLLPGTTPPTLSASGNVKLSVSATTDVWRKPPALNTFNAPYMYRSIPVSSFKSVRVTVHADWKMLYDQGGLMLVFPPTTADKKRWVKTGIEFYHGKPMVSVVAADAWADWSLTPGNGPKATVEVEREEEEDGYGSVLRVSLVDDDGTKTPIREVTWAFHDLDETQDMWVGMAVAKPIKGGHEVLDVHFEGFDLQTRE